MTAKKRGPPEPLRSGPPRARAGGPSKASRGASSTRRKKVPGDAASSRVASSDHTAVIVGIGGSAGSLSPLRELLAALPPESGMAFVVVSHQASTGQSLLPEILSKTTDMPVREIGGATRVERNHVYVVPRGHSVAVHDAVLAIEPIGEPRRVPLPIDFFFRTLAQDLGHRAVGIILSGTGSDGTLGLGAIRAEGGLCLAQDPTTAEFDGMPTSAIAAEVTDFRLAPKEMPTRLLAFAAQVAAGCPAPGALGGAPGDMDRLIALIRARAGQDFSGYKRGTLQRRIERRMDLRGIERLGDYVRHLESSDDEIDALWRDWLIGVSGFFRDPDAFHALAESGLPALLAARPPHSPLRVWVPGCATGEEAYSIAIVVLEALASLGKHLDIQVFATDLDPTAIQTARTGRYPKKIAGEIGAKRLDRFFTEEQDAYRAKKELRDRIVFAVQNVLHDPPFTRVDLVSCRNLLIYFVPSAQQSLLSVFHYSLNPDGLLMLGASEHVGGSAELFSTLDKRWKLFRRTGAAAVPPPYRWTPRALHARAPEAAALSDGVLTETLRRRLAERFGPPAVVVDLHGQIQQTHGRVGPYLELPPGRANLNVVEMARGGLRAPLTSALRECAKAGARVVQKDVSVKANDEWVSLCLTVERIEGPRLPSPLLIVSFQPATSPARRSHRKRALSSKGGRLERAQLEEELQHIRQDLEGSISELQGANEELASANEEVQSANEELQSSNEELQTSKEETQSLNEELHTVNAELTEKLQGIEQANDDLLNLMSNLEIATIFLDDRLRVKRFTPQARRVARLIDTDVGRPLADLATLVDYPDLLSDAGSVLASLRPVEKQAPAPGGVWYTVRIRPYRTARNAVEGLVVTFIDITETKRAERVQAARSLAESIVDAVREPLLVLDETLRVVRANRSFYRVFQVEPADTDGHLVEDLGSQQWNLPQLRSRLEDTLRDGGAFDGFEVIHEFPGIGRKRMVLSGRPVAMQGAGTAALIVVGIHDADEDSAASRENTEEPET